VRESGIRDELDPPRPLDVTRVPHGDRIGGSLAEPRTPLRPRDALLRSAT
jgi:hypothetical protein